MSGVVIVVCGIVGVKTVRDACHVFMRSGKLETSCFAEN